MEGVPEGPGSVPAAVFGWPPSRMAAAAAASPRATAQEGVPERAAAAVPQGGGFGWKLGSAVQGAPLFSSASDAAGLIAGGETSDEEAAVSEDDDVALEEAAAAQLLLDRSSGSVRRPASVSAPGSTPSRDTLTRSDSSTSHISIDLTQQPRSAVSSGGLCPQPHDLLAALAAPLVNIADLLISSASATPAASSHQSRGGASHMEVRIT